jgi:hypothetical protein
MADAAFSKLLARRETLARKRLELVIVGARSASLSRTHPIANVPLRRDIQSSGEIPLLIRCRCSDGDRRFNLWLEEAEIRGRFEGNLAPWSASALSAARAACQWTAVKNGSRLMRPTERTRKSRAPCK